MGQDSQTDPGPPLLFVNRDATNLSRTRAEAFAVGSHTSSVYRKWAKSERLRNLRREARVLQSAKVRLDPFPHGPEQSPVEKGYEVEDAESPRTVIALLKAAVVQVKQFSIPAKLSIDGQRHPPNFYRAMEYFIRVLVPNNLPVYSIFQVSNVNCLYFLEIVASSSAQYLYHAAFALLHLVVGNVIPQTNSSQNALQHTVAAIVLLRKLLSEHPDQNDDATFVAIVCLASYARAVGDYAGYQIHRQRIIEMMKTRGGLQNTGSQGFVKALTLQFAPPCSIPLSLCFYPCPLSDPTTSTTTVAALAAAAATADPFFYNTRQFLPEPPPLTSPGQFQANLSIDLQRLPRGFQNLIVQTRLYSNTIQLLLRIDDARTEQSSLAHNSEQHHGKRNKNNNKNNDNTTGRVWQVGRYSDFWECCPAISRAGLDLEKYLCLALMLYTANEFAPQRVCHKGLALYSGPRALMAGEIVLLDRQTLTESQRHCWMWIWWVLIDSWNEEDKPTEKGTQLMAQFWAAFPEVQLWDDLRGILGHFFWGGKLEAAVRRLEEDAHATASASGNIQQQGCRDPPLLTLEHDNGRSGTYCEERTCRHIDGTHTRV